MRTISLAAACLFLSCSHLGMRTAKTEFIREDFRGRMGRALFVLEEISVDMGPESDRVRKNGEHILRVLFEKRKAAVKDPAGVLSVRVRLKEESFLRDYRTVNTVSVESALYERESSPSTGENPAALSLYSEDTGETLSSYAYLHGFLVRAFGRLR